MWQNCSTSLCCMEKYSVCMALLAHIWDRAVVITIHAHNLCTTLQQERPIGSHQTSVLCSSSLLSSRLLFVCFNKNYRHSRCRCLASQSMLCSAESHVAQKCKRDRVVLCAFTRKPPADRTTERLEQGLPRRTHPAEEGREREGKKGDFKILH